MENKFSGRDLRFLTVCLLVAGCSLWIGMKYFYQAYPEASISFKVTKSESRSMAEDVLAARQWPVAKYRHSSIFTYNNTTKTFLERQLGLEEATKVIGQKISLWIWSHRWFQEAQKEEYSVRIAISGELLGFSRLLEEDAPGAQWSSIQARALARKFISGVPGLELSNLEFIEEATTKRKHRTDHSITWKLRGFEVDGATYRYSVEVQGDEVGAFRQYLKIPETWLRDFDKLRSKNQATGLGAAALLVLTLMAMIGSLIFSIRRQEVPWRMAGIFAAITFLLSLLSSLNGLPVNLFSFSTTDTYSGYILQQILVMSLVALATGALSFIVVAAGEPVYRRAFPGHLHLGRQFLLQGLRTKRFFKGTILGLTMTAVFFTYQTIFYLVAEKWGAWSPAQVPYTNMINSYIPWITVLFIGFQPAIFEEFMSRAFSIPFFAKLLKFRWLAIVVAALIWGFAHATYPQQPFYIRGLELGVVGIMVGFVMLRWGLLPCMVWHFTFNGFHTALIFMKSGNPYLVLSAAASCGLMLFPLAVAVVLYIRHRSFADSAPLLNQQFTRPLSKTVSQSPDELEQGRVSSFEPLPLRRMGILVGLALLSLLLFLWKTEKLGHFIQFKINRVEAMETAKNHLSERGVAHDGYRTAVYFSPEAQSRVIKYVMEQSGVSRVNKIYRDDTGGSVWWVRFFRPLEEEEYRVAVGTRTGQIHSVYHIMAEDAKGASLSEAEALGIAEDKLESRGFDLNKFVLKTSDAKDKKNRRDHRFVWEARPGDPRHVNEALYRTGVDVSGDEPVWFDRFLKLPETWTRARDKTNFFQAGSLGLEILIWIAVVGHMAWLLLGGFRSSAIRFRAALWISAGAAGLFALNWFGNYPASWRAYATQWSSGIFLTTQAVTLLIGTIGIVFMLVLAFSLIQVIQPGCLDVLKGRLRAPMAKDALILAFLAVLGSLGLQQGMDILVGLFPAHVPFPSVPVPMGIDSVFPAVAGFTQALRQTVYWAVILGILMFYLKKWRSKPVLLAVVLVGYVLISAGADSIHIGEFVFGALVLAAKISLLLIGAVFFLRKNLLAYVLVPFALASTSAVSALILQPNGFFQAQGMMLALVSLVILTLIYLSSRKRYPA